MNNLEQQQPPEKFNSVRPHDFNQQKSTSYVISRLSSQSANEDENDFSLSTFFHPLSLPALYYIIDDNKILFNHAFEELCTQSGNENISVEQTIERLWEAENMPAVINDLLNNCSDNEIKKINRTAKLYKQQKLYSKIVLLN